MCKNSSLWKKKGKGRKKQEHEWQQNMVVQGTEKWIYELISLWLIMGEQKGIVGTEGERKIRSLGLIICTYMK